MADGTNDFSVVDRVEADAVGVPGQRRFRLRARTADQFAQLWVEREQTQALGLALEQLLAQVQVRRQERPVAADAGGPLNDFPPTPTVEFTVGRLGIGYDDERDLIVLQVTDIEQIAAGEEDEEPAERPDMPTLVIRFTRAQAAALREQCEATLAAGRPRCPLCGAPMGAEGQHFCIRANGHAKSTLGESAQE
jgi:uncharacterized repeat protein (TIGR03847 family)